MYQKNISIKIKMWPQFLELTLWMAALVLCHSGQCCSDKADYLQQDFVENNMLALHQVDQTTGRRESSLLVFEDLQHILEYFGLLLQKNIPLRGTGGKGKTYSRNKVCSADREKKWTYLTM